MKYLQQLAIEAEGAHFAQDFAPVIEHVEAAQDFEEWSVRALALRVCRRRWMRAAWPLSDLKARQRHQLDCYREELAWRRQFGRQIQRHRARLLASGVAPEHLHHYPYRTRAQQRGEAERLCYIRHALRAGLPMPWEQMP